MRIDAVVVNASPLIALFRSGQDDLLPGLFSRVFVPDADYLAAGGVSPDQVSLEAPRLPPTEVLVDSHAGAAPTGGDHGIQTDAAALDHAPVDLPEPAIQDEQHHGM